MAVVGASLRTVSISISIRGSSKSERILRPVNAKTRSFRCAGAAREPRNLEGSVPSHELTQAVGEPRTRDGTEAGLNGAAGSRTEAMGIVRGGRSKSPVEEARIDRAGMGG